MKLKDSTYDALKFIAINVIPSLETFWLAIAAIWKLPYGQEVGITIGAIGVLLAGCIGMSVSAYNRAKQEEHEGQAD